MAERLVTELIATLSGRLSSEALCFIISLFPVLELRGGLLAASPAFLDVPLYKALPYCIVGNLLPVPFILLFIEKVLALMERMKLTKRIAVFLKEKAERNRPDIEKYGFWGLVLFVGIPLPGTGAWTGCLAAALMHIPFRKAFAACIAGVLIAAVIMTLISYGILGGLAGII